MSIGICFANACGKQSRKENPILFVPDYRDQIRLGIGRHVRFESKAILLGRPADRRTGAEERTFEMLRRVLNLGRCHGPVPFDVERNLRLDGKDAGDRRVGKAQTLCQRVGKVVIVKYLHAAYLQAGVRAV